MSKIQINYIFLIIVFCFSSMSSQNLIFKKFEEQKNTVRKGVNQLENIKKVRLNSFNEQKIIYLNRPQVLELEVVDNLGAIFILDLYKVDIVSDLAKSKYPMKQNEVFYRGVLRSDANSIVSLAIFKDKISISVNTKGKSYKLKGSKNRSKSNYKLIRALLTKKSDNTLPDCDVVSTTEELQVVSDRINAYTNVTKASVAKNAIANSGYIGVYFEVHDDVVINEGGVVGANQYLMELFNVVATIYANEGIDIRVSDLFFWETPSPYTANSAGGLTSQFLDFRGTNWQGNIAQMVSMRAFGGNAIGLGGFCRNGVLGTMSSADIGFGNGQPQSERSISISILNMAHEIGHLLGSPHTFECVWNGDNTAIDGCNQPSNSECPQGPRPPGNGTIMSYCFNGSNLPVFTFEQGLGPQPGNLIRNLIFENLECLTPSTTTIKVSPKVVLQGAMLYSSDGLMRDDLRNEGYLPVRSPYEDNIPVASNMFDITGGNAIIDWVFIELRSASDNTNVVGSQSALLQRDGDVVNMLGVNELDFDLPAGNYYVVVKHRNHLGIMTNVAQQLSTTTTVVDFRNSNVVTYGNNARTSSRMPAGILGMWAGDANQNGIVNMIGVGNDANFIRDVILNDPINAPIQFYGFTVQGYNNADVNLTGGTNMVSAENDSNVIRDNILNHPINLPLQFYGFSIVEQLPGSSNNRIAIPSLQKKSFEQNNFNIVPNPNNGVFNVILQKNEVVDEVTILDINGAKVQHGFNKTFDNNIIVYTSGLKSGMYIIAIISNGITKRKQLIIN